MYPMKLKAAYKDYLWGGTRLKEEFGKGSPIHPIAESWEVSCHPDGPSFVVNGAFAGSSLWDVLSANPDMMGTKCTDRTRFPILIKLIDAEQELSLQVHPDDIYAGRVENQLGKNEMWYIADCKPGAQIILGFEHELTKNELRCAIADNTILRHVNRIPINPGDCFCIPAGMLHAIGGGILVAEVQQSSNITYRVYDYGRRDANGSLRELHIDKAVDVTDPSLKPVKSDYGRKSAPGYDTEQLSRWDYFNARRYTLHGVMEMEADNRSFHTYICLGGGLTVEQDGNSLPLAKGESVFLPAGLGGYTLKGDALLLYTSL